MTKSRSSSDAIRDRDSALREFVRSVVEAAQRRWRDGVVTEENLSFDPLLLYTETHYALAAILLALQHEADRRWLDLAESRFALWNRGQCPVTFFQAMAVCLGAILIHRSNAEHVRLQSILTSILSRTREHRHVAYPQWCGNNAYLQQVAVDTVLLPVATGREITDGGLTLLMSEFRKFLTPEGFFYDLPRDGAAHELLLPPTYIMKILFLAGVCHEVHPTQDLAALFQSSMASVLPFLTREGSFSYFGRTDNSPFAAGLTIFNLRKAAALDPRRRAEYQSACVRAEHFYRTFPRTAAGLLRCNRFSDPTSALELARSHDEYAYTGQYSLASCAYALLGCHWFPTGAETAEGPPAYPIEHSATAQSKDLGVVKIVGPNAELVVRTGSEITSRDRRYLGPTILRYEVDRRLLIGAISRTLSSDWVAREKHPSGRLRRLVELLRDRFAKGDDQLDGTSVGFLPIVRRGVTDYLPYQCTSLEVSPTGLHARYRMVRLLARGYHPCAAELVALLHQNLPGLRPKRFIQPAMRPVDSLELTRDMQLQPSGLRIEDRLSGDLKGKQILFSVRSFPCARVHVEGPAELGSVIGWGSDGRQTHVMYHMETAESEIRYECHISPR